MCVLFTQAGSVVVLEIIETGTLGSSIPVHGELTQRSTTATVRRDSHLRVCPRTARPNRPNHEAIEHITSTHDK